MSAFLREVPCLDGVKKHSSIRVEISKMTCEVKATVLERARGNAHRSDSASTSSTPKWNYSSRPGSDSKDIIADIIGDNGGELSGEAANERDSNGDVTLSECAIPFYINIFRVILQEKIVNFFDSPACLKTISIPIYSPAPITSIRDNVLELLYRTCESFRTCIN